MQDGQIIKIKGYGGSGVGGGPSGDLYIEFVIRNDTQFERVGDDLHSKVQLDLYTAVLGGEITASTFDGKVKLKVAPGTDNGTQVRLRGKGFPVYKKQDSFGDLIITYAVSMPKQLSPEERKLFEELAKMRQG